MEAFSSFRNYVKSITKHPNAEMEKLATKESSENTEQANAKKAANASTETSSTATLTAVGQNNAA